MEFNEDEREFLKEFMMADRQQDIAALNLTTSLIKRAIIDENMTHAEFIGNKDLMKLVTLEIQKTLPTTVEESSEKYGKAIGKSDYWLSQQTDLSVKNAFVKSNDYELIELARKKRNNLYKKLSDIRKNLIDKLDLKEKPIKAKSVKKTSIKQLTI